MNERPRTPSESRLRAALARSSRHRRRGEPGAAARLCEETTTRLFDHLDPIRLDPGRVVDIAMQCSLGHRLAERFPRSRVLSCGYCPTAFVPGRNGIDGATVRIAASPLRLPLAAASADLVASNLALVWFPDFVPVLREAWRVLRPGGLIVFTTLGPGTLAELRTSWKEVDDRSHLVELTDLHDIGDAMVGTGFADVVMDAERMTVTWPDIGALLEDLRGLGTGNPLQDRPQGLTTPRKLAALSDAYAAREPTGRVSAAVELVHGHGWKPLGRTEVSFDAPTGPR